MTHNFEELKNHILSLSNVNNFNQAKNEWVLNDVELHEEFNSCPCGQPIKELCYIKNQINGNETHVGNVCINRFIEISTGNLFAGLKKIKKDINAKPNEDLIVHAYKLGYLHNEKEYNFLMSIKNKRNFSKKQLSWINFINHRIINKVCVRK